MKATLLPAATHSAHTIDWCRIFVRRTRRSLALKASAVRKRALSSRAHIQTRGFEKGYQDGLASAQATASTLLTSLLEITETRSALYREQVVASAVELAEQIIQRELTTNPEAYRSWLHQALGIMRGSMELHLHYAPEQAQIVQCLIKADYPHLKLIPDDSISPGELVLRGDTGGVRFAWRDALKQIVEETT
jgi:flagellar biosynthesis/type III secretory pathway protein FliH